VPAALDLFPPINLFYNKQAKPVQFGFSCNHKPCALSAIMNKIMMSEPIKIYPK
jgi:hypothetical protein